MKDNFKVVRNIFMFIVFILLLVIFLYLLFKTKDDSLIINVKEYIKTGEKVLYITNKNNYNKYPIDLFEKYDIEYFYINSDNLSRIEKSKLERIINSKYLSNIIVIFENGNIKDAIIEYKDEESLNVFLKKYKIIPEIIGDSKKELSNVSELLKSDYLLIYLPYEKIDELYHQEKILKEIAEEYDINYKRIDAYLLSNNQKNKLNSMLQISSVENQIIILIKDNKIVGSIRDINNKKAYLTKLAEFSFIDEIDSYITYINYSEFTRLLNSNKSIITVGKDDCKYCGDVLKTLNDIAINYDININYINVGKIDSELATSIEKTLNDLGYSDGFTTPLTLIVENNKLLDYIVGASNEKYFVDIFVENGIIK